MPENEEIMQSPGFKDRKAGLVVFGILQIILGGLCALMVPFMVMGMIASASLRNSSAPPVNTSMMVPVILLYVLAAVWFIWMGIGSVKARRWARSLILVSSWLWLICGIGGLVFILLLLPQMYDRMGQSGQMPPAAVAVMKCVMMGFMTVIYVIIPAVLVLFYGSKNVKATCEFRDSKVRWTDKCPLPVLAASLLFGVWAVSMLFCGAYGWTFPFFGFIATGAKGAAIALVVMLLYGYVAIGLYKLNIKAWWCAVLFTILWALSTVITFSRVTLLDFYQKMNFSQQLLDFYKQSGLPNTYTVVLFSSLWFIGFLVYLLYTKKYFAPAPPGEGL
ncbi:MAG: hypothetical protein WAK60_12325 [Sedimentisphaerales bacterium]